MLCGFWVKFVEGEDPEATPARGSTLSAVINDVKPEPRLSYPPPLRLRLMDAGSGSSVMEAAGCGRAAAGTLLKVAA